MRAMTRADCRPYARRLCSAFRVDDRVPPTSLSATLSARSVGQSHVQPCCRRGIFSMPARYSLCLCLTRSSEAAPSPIPHTPCRRRYRHRRPALSSPGNWESPSARQMVWRLPPSPAGPSPSAGRSPRRLARAPFAAATVTRPASPLPGRTAGLRSGPLFCYLSSSNSATSEVKPSVL